MEHKQAVNFLEECVFSVCNEKMPETAADDKNFLPFRSLESIEDVFNSIEYISEKYINKITPGCKQNEGYILYIDPTKLSHPINVFATLYTLMVSDANIYIVYDELPFEYYSFFHSDAMPVKEFLDEFIEKYDKAERITIIKTLTNIKYIALENFIKSHTDIKHFVQIGGFKNFGEEGMLKLFRKFDLRVHLPSAYYVIWDYENEKISDEDNEKMVMFAWNCREGYFDWAAYQSKSNKFKDQLFQKILDPVENELTKFDILKSIAPLADKVTTIIFTDKSRKELKYPAEFYECFNVYLSKNFIYKKMLYDFTDLLK